MRHCIAVKKTLFASTTVVALCVASMLANDLVASASASPNTSTYLLYAGHGVGVVATETPSNSCGSVFVTTDFQRWRNVTPPTTVPPSTPKGQCDDVWSDAYFVSRSDGWLMAIDTANVSTLLFHTLNGGSTWTREPGGETGSAGGFETISFTNATVGWRQQFGMGSNGDYSLQRTVNAGTTWTTRAPDPRGSCETANDVFSSPNVGFASVAWAPANNPTNLWRSGNGGTSWSVMTLPLPPTVASNALGFYGQPVFSGKNGTIPVDYPVQGHQDIYFYGSNDRGLTWTLNSNLPVIVLADMTINRQVATSQTCNVAGAIETGHPAIVALANPATWWILQPGHRGSTRESIVSQNGQNVTLREITDLPATYNQPDLAALNSHDALITIAVPNGYRSTYQTSNGGVTWKKMVIGSTAPRT
jgi:hypothetical protein